MGEDGSEKQEVTPISEEVRQAEEVALSKLANNVATLADELYSQNEGQMGDSGLIFENDDFEAFPTHDQQGNPGISIEDKRGIGGTSGYSKIVFSSNRNNHFGDYGNSLRLEFGLTVDQDLENELRDQEQGPKPSGFATFYVFKPEGLVDKTVGYPEIENGTIIQHRYLGSKIETLPEVRTVGMTLTRLQLSLQRAVGKK